MIYLFVFLLLFSSCRIQKVTRETEQAQKEVRETNISNVELKTDSTLHNYHIVVIKEYDKESGKILREEQRQEGTIQVSVKESKQESTEEVSGNKYEGKEIIREELSGKSAPVHESEIKSQEVGLEKTKTINKRVFVIAVALVIIVIVFLVWRICRRS